MSALFTAATPRPKRVLGTELVLNLCLLNDAGSSSQYLCGVDITVLNFLDTETDTHGGCAESHSYKY